MHKKLHTKFQPFGTNILDINQCTIYWITSKSAPWMLTCGRFLFFLSPPLSLVNYTTLLLSHWSSSRALELWLEWLEWLEWFLTQWELANILMFIVEFCFWLIKLLKYSGPPSCFLFFSPNENPIYYQDTPIFFLLARI